MTPTIAAQADAARQGQRFPLDRLVGREAPARIAAVAAWQIRVSAGLAGERVIPHPPTRAAPA